MRNERRDETSSRLRLALGVARTSWLRGQCWTFDKRKMVAITRTYITHVTNYRMRSAPEACGRIQPRKTNDNITRTRRASRFGFAAMCSTHN